MSTELTVLLTTAAAIGVIHTLMGPDHYLPFAALAKARDWSLRRTLAITFACGVGHVLSSVVLGLVGIAVGWKLVGLQRLEDARGELAGWLLLAFGLVYLAWGVRRALRSRPHSHWHTHDGGLVHRHEHVHQGEHLHPHDLPEHRHEHPAESPTRSVTPWVLFVLFLFGPCESLIPLLIYPAARGGWSDVAAVATVFAVCTLAVMLLAVALLYRGLERLSLGRLERWAHALAGAALVACGVGMRLGL